MYGIDFTRFKIRDLETGTTLFEIAKPVVGAGEEEEAEQGEGMEPDPNAGRFVRYQFTPQVGILILISPRVNPRSKKAFLPDKKSFQNIFCYLMMSVSVPEAADCGGHGGVPGGRKACQELQDDRASLFQGQTSQGIKPKHRETRAVRRTHCIAKLNPNQFFFTQNKLEASENLPVI